MIGVVANPNDFEVVRELFEFFKTPWEFYEAGHDYEVILAPVGKGPPEKIPLRIIFGSEFIESEDEGVTGDQKQGISLITAEGLLPLYKDCFIFKSKEPDLAVANHPGSAAQLRPFGTGITLRLGYNLYDEIRFLLVYGQPEWNAPIPTLDQHIELLRQFIVHAGVQVIEIPPSPAGHPFSVCLTHDIDHPLIRNHKVDHTAIGFLYRATLGSALQTIRRKMPFRTLLKNLSAAICFPLVQLGLARDFWGNFDRYLEIEKGLASTFFIIPKRGNPGININAAHAERRSASYTIEEISPQINQILKRGGEIALHGIDAWTDESKGKAERTGIAAITGTTGIGVRMHWLCFDEATPSILDLAGFTYDSTVGYNGTVGYRAGTLQAYRPLKANQLLELPLHIMDTALFCPSHLNLDPTEAKKIVNRCIADAIRFGGVLTLNWHDRSIAPERQWEDIYVKIVTDLKQHNPWFATASQAIAWFRMRRSAVFEEIRDHGQIVKVKVTTSFVNPGGLPGLRLRVTAAVDSSRFQTG